MEEIVTRKLVETLEVFSAKRCEQITERLESLRSQWYYRGMGFHTFGLATYLDIMSSVDPVESYYARLKESNARIVEHFGEELDEIRVALEHLLSSPARFEPTVALPGFHIFEGGGICVSDNPSQHFDLQHRFLHWPFEISREEENVISFTLAFKLPKLGGGLDVWDIEESDLARLQRLGRETDMVKLGRTKPHHLVNYANGSMVVQMRPIMHRIASIAERSPGDQRITLQGHGLKHNGEWILYW